MNEKLQALRDYGMQACNHTWSTYGVSKGLPPLCSKCGISKPNHLEEFWNWCAHVADAHAETWWYP